MDENNKISEKKTVVDLTGTVEGGGGIPIKNSQVFLYQAGNGETQPATLLESTQTDAQGRFTLTTSAPDSQGLLYIIVKGGSINTGSDNAAIGLAAVLGQADQVPSKVVVDELSTVATAWSMSQFLNGTSIAGEDLSLSVATATYNNLVDVTSGKTAPRLVQTTPSWQKFNTIANILASCVTETNPDACQDLFAATTSSNGEQPTDTLQATLNLAQNPLNVSPELFALSFLNPAYDNALPRDRPPTAWDIFLQHFGGDPNNSVFDGPGNIAIDKEGNIWVTNNFTVGSSDGGNPPLPGNSLVALTPGGDLLPGSPFKGGGLYGAGFGIGIDPKDRIWVGNFGFGSDSPLGLVGNGNSVSEFDSNGVPLSPSRSDFTDLRQPSGGYTAGDFLGPQGTVSDSQGNIWIASYSPGADKSKVVVYPNGDPKNAITIDNGQLNPFDIAIDAQDNAWVSYRGSDSLAKITPAGDSQIITGGGLKDPMGLAIDSLGNVWVANNDNGIGNTVSVFDAEGNHKETFPLESSEGSKALVGPWGLAIDGDDNVYVNAFAGQKLFALHGFGEESFPDGKEAGELLSPDNGYRYPDVLLRPTGLEVDPGGNLWVVNNFKTDIFATNPGGDSLLQFVGLAAPVKTPLIGPVQPLEEGVSLFDDDGKSVFASQGANFEEIPLQDDLLQLGSNSFEENVRVPDESLATLPMAGSEIAFLR